MRAMMTKREKDKKELADVIVQDRLVEARSALLDKKFSTITRLSI
jgi:nucleosome binding factor SPN SPT16 subunit